MEKVGKIQMDSKRHGVENGEIRRVHIGDRVDSFSVRASRLVSTLLCTD